MKRDLKKWLRSKEAMEYLGEDEFPGDYTEKMICENLITTSDYVSSGGWKGSDEIVQFIWCAAQKQFLKNILDDVDDAIEKIFNGKDKVKNDKARIVAEEAALKAWLYNKYKYLQGKNGK